jgi:hypothetical protein
MSLPTKCRVCGADDVGSGKTVNGEYFFFCTQCKTETQSAKSLQAMSEKWNTWGWALICRPPGTNPKDEQADGSREP